MARFTYLIPADEVYPGKTITFLSDGSTQQVRPAPSSNVIAEQHNFNDFTEMCEVLTDLIERGEGYIVRADVSPDYIGTRRVFRRKLGKMGDGSVLWRHDPQWICLDLDGIMRPEGLDSYKYPEEVIAHVLSTLPPYFRDVSCFWQFSSTESLPENRSMIKCHLFYMLTNPIPESKLVEWAKSNHSKHKIDPAVMRSNQPIYIAPPKIKGEKDWLRARYGKFLGSADILDLNLFTSRTFNKDSRVTPIDQKKILAKYLSTKLGDGEEREGFNDPIKAAIGAIIQKCGPEIDREELKKDLRQFIKAAPVEGKRSGRSKDDYMSDTYLDPLIDAISMREGDSQKRSYNQYEVARARFVYITNINRFYDTVSGNYITKDALNMTLAKIGRAMGDVFVNDDDFVVVDQLTYFPGRERLCSEIALNTGESTLCFNIYQAPIINDEPSEPAQFFIEHVKRLAGSEYIFKHMMDWMAHNVQKPGVKIMYAMLIQGKQGTGKSALMEAMKMCLGPQNVRAVETHEIVGDFTTWMRGKCMAVVEEIRDTNERFSIYNRLKPVITAPTITLNEKNVAQVEMKNRMNIMAFTNYESAVPMDDDDRRFFVHFSPMQPDVAEYYDELFNIIYKHPGAIRKAFLEWDISHFNPNGRAPTTASKEFLKEHAGPPLTRLLRTSMKHKDWPCRYDIVLSKDVLDAISNRIKVSEGTLVMAMKSLGAESLGEHRIGNSTVTVWCVRNYNNWKDKTTEELNNYYRQPMYDPINKIEGYIGESVVKKNVPNF